MSLYNDKNCKISNYDNKTCVKNAYITKAINFSNRRDWYAELKLIIKNCKQKPVFMETVKLIILTLYEDNATNCYINRFFDLAKIEDVDNFNEEFLNLLNKSTDDLNKIVLSSFVLMMHDYIFNNHEKYVNKILNQYRAVSIIYEELLEIVNNNMPIEEGIINRIKSKGYYIKTSSSELRNLLFSLVKSYNKEVKNTSLSEKEKTPYKFSLEVKEPEKLYTDSEPKTLEGKPLEQLNELYNFLCEALKNKEDYKIVITDIPSLLENLDLNSKNIIIDKLIDMLNNNQDLDEKRRVTLVKRVKSNKN